MNTLPLICVPGNARPQRTDVVIADPVKAEPAKAA